MAEWYVGWHSVSGPTSYESYHRKLDLSRAVRFRQLQLLQACWLAEYNRHLCRGILLDKPDALGESRPHHRPTAQREVHGRAPSPRPYEHCDLACHSPAPGHYGDWSGGEAIPGVHSSRAADPPDTSNHNPLRIRTNKNASRVPR